MQGNHRMKSPTKAETWKKTRKRPAQELCRHPWSLAQCMMGFRYLWKPIIFIRASSNNLFALHITSGFLLNKYIKTLLHIILSHLAHPVNRRCVASCFLYWTRRHNLTKISVPLDLSTADWILPMCVLSTINHILPSVVSWSIADAWNAFNVTVIVVGNRFIDPSSNPGLSWLCFTSR